MRVSNVRVNVELELEVLHHERRGFPNDRGLLTRATHDGAHHRVVARPFLRVGQVRHRVTVGGDELAARQLVDAELRVLNLVVVDPTVKSYHHCPHVLVNLHLQQKIQWEEKLIYTRKVSTKRTVALTRVMIFLVVFFLQETYLYK